MIIIKELPIEQVQPLTLKIPEFNDPYGIEEYYNRFKNVPHLVLAALDGEKIVGFKLGYERKKNVFYSWMGGVLPEYRKQGIAWKLAKRQEIWLKENGYTHLWMKTRNQHRNMLHFAIKNGFQLMEVEQETDDALNRIWLRKKL